MDSKKYSAKVLLEVSEVEMVHTNLYSTEQFKIFTPRLADLSRKECDKRIRGC